MPDPDEKEPNWLAIVTAITPGPDDEPWGSGDFDDTDPDGVEADMLEYYEIQDRIR